MNPIEKDLKNYFGVEYGGENDILEHYGTKRHSGRYPWGSGETPYQHSGDFLSRVDKFKAKGMSEGEILEAINDTLPPEYKLGATEFRVAKTKAGHDRKASQWEDIQKLKKENPDIAALIIRIRMTRKRSRKSRPSRCSVPAIRWEPTVVGQKLSLRIANGKQFRIMQFLIQCLPSS